MTDTTTNTLRDILNISQITSRIESFTWLTAAQTNNQLMDINPEHKDFYPIITQAIQSNSELNIKIQISIFSKTIPIELLNWIGDSWRQLIWIRNLISSLKPYIAAGDYSFLINPTLIPPILMQNTQPIYWLQIPTHLSTKNGSIAAIDYCASHLQCNLDGIINIAMWMRNRWMQYTESDAYFKWLSIEHAEEKREFFKNWLIRKNSIHYPALLAINSHDELLHYFDQLPLFNDTKNLINIDAKKAWNQKARRERQTDKQQLNVVLPTSSIEKLDKLCEKHKISRTEFIQIIIDSESKYETHIKNRLNRKNLLLNDPSSKQPMSP